MIKLSGQGVFLVNGTQIIEENSAEAATLISKEDAAKNTIAYGILEAHNTSGNNVLFL